MTIYEAFTSGKEVRRRSGELIKAMVLIDWIETDFPLQAFDEKGRSTCHKSNGSNYTIDQEHPFDLIVHQPDPHDEVIKAAEAWYDAKGSGNNVDACRRLISAVDNYRESLNNG